MSKWGHLLESDSIIAGVVKKLNKNIKDGEAWKKALDAAKMYGKHLTFKHAKAGRPSGKKNVVTKMYKSKKNWASGKEDAPEHWRMDYYITGSATPSTRSVSLDAFLKDATVIAKIGVL